jgi:hypothetical protein
VQKPGEIKRLARLLAVGAVSVSLLLGFGTAASTAADVTGPTDETSETPKTPETAETTDSPSTDEPDSGATVDSKAKSTASADEHEGVEPPYGWDKPVTLETNFARPYKSISSSANSDFSQLEDLERLIRGSYLDPNTKKYVNGVGHTVFISISRMENSTRVGRELIKAAARGVTVRVIHGKASQSKESRALASALARTTYHGKHYGSFKICQKGTSLACLASGRGAIMHSKILLVSDTFTQEGKAAKAAIWSGSANLGGPSGERTFNNGLTIYNDMKLWAQTTDMWADMWAERNIGTDYPRYVANHDGGDRYGYTTASADGYQDGFTSSNGIFYSELANVTIYAMPIAATPTNNRDPVMTMLDRIVPDDQCHIRLQENRFKYRRIAVAHKLAELANGGCTVEIVSFEDDLKVNRIAHCQMYIRVCRPILDVLKSADVRIPAAWAKPHDKTIMVDAKMTRGAFNDVERLPTGEVWPGGGKTPVRIKLVQAGSAALTGSNLIVSDEITTETTDPGVYAKYLEHWDAIVGSNEFRDFPY